MRGSGYDNGGSDGDNDVFDPCSSNALVVGTAAAAAAAAGAAGSGTGTGSSCSSVGDDRNNVQ